MAEAFRITQEIDFFDVDNYEERASTFDTLHVAAERSMRGDRLRRAAFLLVSVGFLGLFWKVAGGPGASAEAKAHAEAPVVAPSELARTAARQRESEAATMLFEPEFIEAPAITEDPAWPITGPTAWAVAKGFDVLDEEPEEMLEAELSDALLERLSAAAPPAAAPASPVAVQKPASRRAPVDRTAEPRRAAPANPAGLSRSARLERAVLLHDEGRSEEALAELRKLRSHPDALVLRGSIYQDQGDTVGARETYELYLERYPRGGHASSVRSILSRL